MSVSEATRFADLPAPLLLESGASLPQVRVAYRTWGKLADDGANGVLICHALTGSADADDWWSPLFGPGRALDPEHDFVVCSNVLGSCYGTTGPAAERPEGGRWGAEFPAVTVRDLVRVQAALLETLGVSRLRFVLGGSMGGMQVLEWAAMFPETVEAIAPIAVSGRHSAWCIALSEAQRQAIAADPRWRDGRYDLAEPPAAGLAAARAIAMCTYRSRASFEERFGRGQEVGGHFAVEGYLRHQGQKLVDRFDAASYVALTRVMDSHDLARGRGRYEEVLQGIETPALVVSVDSDVLYLPEEQRELAAHLPNARLVTLESIHGHDAFLIEMEALNRRLVEFRAALARERETARFRAPHRQKRSEPAEAGEARPLAPAIPLRRLANRPVQVVVVGATGRVGQALLAQLADVGPRLAAQGEAGTELRLVGAVNSRRMAWNPAGLPPGEAALALAAGEPVDWERLVDRLTADPRRRSLVVDCTASPEIAGRYAALLERGIGVVTPNKLANAGPLASYRRLRELSTWGDVPYRYETTVGAALPVLGPLADLLRAGDRLLGLYAILSGTLAFVLQQLEEGVPFSQAVREAYERGYTEPHPGEDLSGEDVARKLLILTREAGHPFERHDLLVEPLLPNALPDERDPERFLALLARFDSWWSVRIHAARARGARLFYLASFDGITPRVGVMSLPAYHPVARGGPGDNVVVFRTDRYFDQPLVISGPGAGPAVTATGVLADLIEAARDLGRREEPGGGVARIVPERVDAADEAKWRLAQLS